MTSEPLDAFVAAGHAAAAHPQASLGFSGAVAPSDPSAVRSASLGIAGGSRAGAWLGACALTLALGAIIWFFASLVRDVEAADFSLVETDRVRVDSGPGWVDSRWSGLIASRLAQLGDLRADDSDAHALVEDALLELPFIASVGETRVLWPDGLEVSVTFREPVACVRIGSQFVVVASDGLVLPGVWPAPPGRGTGFLPVLAVDDSASELIFEGALVQQPALVDGLSIATSMWSELDADDLARLGRIAIDARRARQASVGEPGAVFWLEGARRVDFGRSPNLGEPGELPVVAKWESLSRALRLLDPDPASGKPQAEKPHFFDWEMVDVRWDRPELLVRGGNATEELEQRAPKSSTPRKKKPGDTRSAPHSGVR